MRKSVHSFVAAVALLGALADPLSAQTAPPTPAAGFPTNLPTPVSVPAPRVRSTDTLVRTSAAGTPVTVIAFDLADPRVHVSVTVAHGFPHGDEPFSSMVHRANPVLAVDGAYFSTTDFAPIGDIVVGGQMIYQGLMGTALAITRDNQALMRRVELDRGQDWSAYETVLECGPALVLNGSIVVNPALERFHDPHIMRPGPRMGVALSGTRLLVVTTSSAVTFQHWAEMMAALGARDAMNLDGAASLALYYRGKTYIAPSRKLTNILTVSLDDPLKR